MKPFILASGSPRRRELLASLGVTFTVQVPHIDETQFPDESPAVYVQRLSQQKAAAIAQTRQTPAVILAADTIVIDGKHVLGKPADALEARSMLQQLRGRAHQVCTAFTLYSGFYTPAYHITRMDCTTVLMRAYTDTEIDAYIATGDPFDKAGSYAIQHPVFAPVAEIHGSYSNVVGLPLEALQSALQETGWETEAKP